MSIFSPLDLAINSIEPQNRGFLTALLLQEERTRRPPRPRFSVQGSIHQRGGHLYPHCQIPFSKELGQESCPICLIAYRKEELVHLLPCHHAYHSKCISTWIQQKKQCPVCKLNV